MFSKSQIKLITSLAQKKYRNKHKLFLAEGIKVISELLDSKFPLHSLYTTENVFDAESGKTFAIGEADLKKISQLKTPQKALALFEIPQTENLDAAGLVVALDGIRDPGNLGTIIRLCDWFGVEQIICSLDTVDCYNPKVVQATMGSISRVKIEYKDLPLFLSKQALPVFGAFMEGSNIYQEELPSEGILVLGNEANGISEDIEKLVQRKISIPRFGKTQATESLNVATATAILLSEFRRGFIGK